MRQRSEHCLSDLQLDRWLASELAPAEQRAAEQHVERCDVCQRRRAEFSESMSRFAREAPPFAGLERRLPGPASRQLPRSARRHGGRWFLGVSVLVAATAAAAALALAVGTPWLSGPSSERDLAGSGTRTKGGLGSLGWVVRRGERVFEGSPEQRLRAGDALRFTVSAQQPVYVAVLGLDAQRKLSAYYPDGELLAKVAAGHEQPLPTAIELDAAPGPEHLYGVFCPSAVPLARVKDAIEQSLDTPALPLGCSFERWTLHKEAP